MDAFGVVGHPTRRHILELLASGEQCSGTITRAISEERGISEAAVSQHLKALLDNGLASVRPAGMNRFYTVNPDGLRRIMAWITQFPQLDSREPRPENKEAAAVEAVPAHRRFPHRHTTRSSGLHPYTRRVN
ncbi:metalloregulator ArsR/SmtB family transcription factor [Nocardia sp. NPDC052254]|uniref:ArsR/SmtB family transcription factor n=1 Tax=Nocardia sp. NPDC052254 TaxID=3155681 RepID=UPI00342BB472